MSAKPFIFTSENGLVISFPAAVVPALEDALREYRHLPSQRERDIGSAVAAALCELGCATCPEIAGAIRRRTADVRRVLVDDERFILVPPPAGRSPKANTWALASGASAPVPWARTSADDGVEQPS